MIKSLYKLNFSSIDNLECSKNKRSTSKSGKTSLNITNESEKPHELIKSNYYEAYNN